MKINILLAVIGVLLFGFGIYLSMVEYEPHFYTFFSIGLLIIVILVYNGLFNKNIFDSWKFREYLIFFFAILIMSVIIDKIGVSFGYWDYPNFSSVYDEILKYIFEWTIPLIAYMIAFMIGLNLFSKITGKYYAVLLSLFTFVLFVGFVTEYVNSFSLSWQILKMPLLNYNFKMFSLGFVTLGYWFMTLITYSIYCFVEWWRK